MKFAQIYNKVSFDIDTRDYKYKKLNELDKTKTYTLNGFYINTSKFGKQAVLIVNELKALVNIPMHLTETFNVILSDVEAVETIKNGKVGFTIREYEKNQKKCFTISFVDL